MMTDTLRSMSRMWWLIVCSSMVLIDGCASRAEMVRRRAAEQYGCPIDELHVTPIPGGAYAARGCGRTVTYICNGNLCVVDTAVDTPDAASREPDPVAAEWPESSIRALVASLRSELQRCFHDGPIRFDLRVMAATDGRITHAGVLGGVANEVQQQCVNRLFARAHLDGRARRNTMLVLGVDLTDEVTSGGTGPVQDLVAVPVVDDEASASVRLALEAHRAAILACVDAEAVAVTAYWGVDGAVTFSLRGASAGTADDACVRAAIGAMTIDPAPGTAGSIVHALAR